MPYDVPQSTVVVVVVVVVIVIVIITSFLWQRVSVLIQRFNSVLIGETFLHPDEAPDEL